MQYQRTGVPSIGTTGPFVFNTHTFVQDIAMGTSVVNPAAIPRLLNACQAVVERWEHGDLAEAVRMYSEAANMALAKQCEKDDGRTQAIDALLAKAEAAGLKAEDLDETVHEMTASIAADVNNSGMDGQLGYLIDEMGGEAVGKELDRLAAEKAPSTTVAGDEEVRAECHSDDRIYSADFNALRWFEQAHESEVLELAEDDWGDSYAADRVGMFMADFVPDVQRMFGGTRGTIRDCCS
jgi:hypothetical protein